MAGVTDKAEVLSTFFVSVFTNKVSQISILRKGSGRTLAVDEYSQGLLGCESSWNKFLSM